MSYELRIMSTSSVLLFLKFLIEKSVNYYFMFPYYAFALTMSDLTFIKTKLKIIISIILLSASIAIMFI